MNTTQYHETLWQAVQAATNAIPAGHAINVAELRDAFQPMSYETNQTRLITLESNQGQRNRRQVLRVDIYRMHTGRYEVTAYAA